jgi:hypothetical protein
MKTLSIILAAALLAACKKEAPAPHSDINITRRIEQRDKLLESITVWTMSVWETGIYFHSFTADGSSTRAILNGTGTLASQGNSLECANQRTAATLFKTYADWTATAKANHVEAFWKKIPPNCVYEFSGRDATLTSFSGPSTAPKRDGVFHEADIAKFSELLKQYPEAEHELRERIAKAAKESQLFK